MKDYINLALRTAAGTVYPVNNQLLHCAIGMVTETAEMDTAGDKENYLEELGDVMWYVAIGCNELGVSLEDAEEMAGADQLQLGVIAADFIGLLKKEMFYGKPADPVEQTVLLGSMIAGLREAAQGTDSSLEREMENNIAKLKKRYPDKFTEERANNR